MQNLTEKCLITKKKLKLNYFKLKQKLGGIIIIWKLFYIILIFANI